APSIPTGLTATLVTNTQIYLTWNASTDTSGSGNLSYVLYRNGTFLTQVSATSTFDDGLAPDTTYSYTVSAVNGATNESAQSISTSVTTGKSAIGSFDSTPPSVPTGVSATPNSCSQITVFWTASTDSGSRSTGVRGYYVYRDGIFLRSVAAPATVTS